MARPSKSSWTIQTWFQNLKTLSKQILGFSAVGAIMIMVGLIGLIGLSRLKSELQKQGIFTTTLEELYNWGRKNSIWPLQFGLACCAIEMIATTMPAMTLRGSARKCSGHRRGRRT